MNCEKIKFKKLLLVNLPVSKGKYTIPDFPPVGIGYLSQSLILNGIEHDVLDMMLGYKVDYLLSLIEKEKYDIVGFSLFTYQYLSSYKIISTVKNKFSHIKVVAGGPHVSTMRTEVLVECFEIDYGVVLEGERAIVQICKGTLPIENIPGLIYRLNGNIKVNNPEYIRELDKIPYPRFEKFELKKYSKNIAIFTSRGCPYACTYCPVLRTIGNKYRYRSPSSIVDEIRYWYEKGYRRILVLDDNFTLIAGRVKELCQLLRSLKLNGLMLSCSNGIRADKVDRDILKEMKFAGFNEIAFGVEAGNNKVLKAIQKSETVEIIEARIKEACGLDFKVVLFFIIGSPSETYDDFLESVALALRYPVYSARFYNLIPFPHSKLFEWVKSNNYFVIPPEKYLNDASHHVNQPIFATPEFSLDERKKAFKLALKIEKVIKRKYITNKFKGAKLISGVFAYFYTNDLINYLYNNIPILRHVGLKIRKHI